LFNQMKHFYLLLLFLFSFALSQPKFEFRGLWVAASGIDFPLSVKASYQKQELDRIVDVARNGGFNAIIFQVLARGQAYYESNIVPWASYLTSSLTNVVITSVGLESILTDFNLSPGYPNPFNSVINFSYSVPSGSFVDIRIYDLLGREVKKIVSGFHFNGRYQFYWDGTDNNGVEVASGFYVCRMNAFKNGKVIFSNSQKISFLK
jgi:hypothetical protein